MAGNDETSPALPPEPNGAGGTPTHPAEGLHRPIGPYFLLRKIGEGGFGEVHVAAQVEPVKRRVALKILKAGMDTKAVLARFDAERQALAAMDHPHIAKVLDAGETEQGRPYFVMELVRGEPLTRYCDRHALDVRRRLELFVEICRAVQHAHQRGIIHRDLKPSNILVEHVDGAPLPKVIDFGIAKARGTPLGDGALTVGDELLGTPEYMSPEQAGAGAADVDTRTDVYSLGVILYELLTGRRPFESETLRSGGITGIPRALRELEAARPSTRVTPRDPDSRDVAARHGTDPRALARALRGDLDRITLKAIEKDRERRYGSPAELADDVLRHLRHEPVQARAPTAGYRLRKFARRRRGLVIGTSAFLAAAVAGVAATAWQAVRATRAERIARAEAAVAAAVNDFLIDMLAEANPERNPRGRSVTVAEILDRAAAKVDELDVTPDVRSRLQATIGGTYRELGDYAQAETHLGEALRTRRESLAADDPAIAESLDELGELLWMQGKYDEIVPLWEESRRIREAQPRPDDLGVATSLNNLAALAFARGELDTADGLYSESLALRRRARGEEHEDVAESLSNLAVLRQTQGRMEEAEALFRESLGIYRKALGGGSLQVATLTDNLAVNLKQQGRLEEAEPLYREALAIRERVLGHEHALVAANLNNLGRLLEAREDWPAAEAALREALAIRRRLLGDESPHTAESLANLGSLVRATGRLEESETMLASALAATRAALGPDHPRVANAETSLATTLARRGRPREALPLLRDALRIRREKLPADHPLVADAEEALRACLAEVGGAGAARGAGAGSGGGRGADAP